MDLIERLPEGAHRHPWEIARSKFILNLLRRYEMTACSTWLDVGTGDAWLAGQISRSIIGLSRFVGWDINFSDNDIATLGNDSPIELMSETPTGQFEVILMLDVLEHIENDTMFLQDAVSHLLDSNGWVLITVPAYQFLFSEHDRMLRHFRRYSPNVCRKLIMDSGLEIVNQGGLYSSLLLARSLQNLSGKRRTTKVEEPTSLWRHGDLLTNSFAKALEIEGAFDSWFSRKSRKMLPGLSYWALCRKA
jgi:hypothetical protein